MPSIRWTILAMLFVARTGLGFQFQTVGSTSGALTAELGFSYAEVGTLIGLFMLPGAFLAIGAGYLGRHLSDRALAGLGLLALGAGGALGAVAGGFELLALGRLACGLGFVLSTIYFTKMVAEWFSGRELATAMGVLVMSWPFGIAMGQIGHEWLAETVSWRAAFWVAAAWCMAGAVLVLAAYRSPGSAQASAQEKGRPRMPGSELALIVLASLVWGFFNAGYVVYLSFAPEVLASGGLDRIAAAALISVASWVMIVSGPACGYVADRWRRPDAVLYLCMLVAVVSLLLLPQTELALPVALAFGLLGMAPAGVIMALTGEAMAPERRAFGMGIFFTLYFVVVTPAPALAGWLRDRGGDAMWPIGLAVALFALTAASNAGFRFARKRLPVPA